MPVNTPMPQLPRLTDASASGLMSWANLLVRSIELQINLMNAPPGKLWTTTNVTPSRALDASAATLAQTREALATLIVDLQAGGSIPD